MSGNNAANNNYGIGLYLSSNNSIYNNIFNNTYNIYLDTSNINTWNTTLQSSPNIINGYSLGGNFWANPSGTGYSQTCADGDSDGICDSPNVLASNNIDYLPLTTDLTTDITPPIISINGFPWLWLHIEKGSSANLSIIITDDHPNIYQIYRNSTLVSSGKYSNGTVFNISIDTSIITTWVYTISANDTVGNEYTTTAVVTVQDTTPPESITNLSNISYAQNYVNWTWNDPSDSDFSHVKVYIDGNFKKNVFKGIQYYNATNLSAGTIHTISTHTVDIYGNMNQSWKNHTARTALMPDITPPIVTSPSINQSDIPDDTDNEPLWGETAQLNVTVTDESNISSVTINLSEIGGLSAKPMLNIGDNIYSTTTNASAGTSPKLYNLTVNATDMYGNSNTSVRIQLKVMKNGDTTENNVVNIGDALRLANNVSYPGNPAYALSSIYAADVTGNGVINIGDALRLANNVSYPGNPAYILK